MVALGSFSERPRPTSLSLASARSVKAFAHEWAELLLGTTGLSGSQRRVRSTLVTLSGQLCELLTMPEFCPKLARRLGADLAAMELDGDDVLPLSLRLMRQRAATAFAPGPHGDARVLDVLDELAAGYADGLRDRTEQHDARLLRDVLGSRQDAEVALRVSEARFRTIFSKAAIGICIGAIDGTLLEANPALLTMFGLTGQVAPATQVTDFVHPDDSADFVRLYHDLIAGRRDALRTEIRFVRPDGVVLWTQLTSSLVRADDSSPSYVIAIVEDVSERHQLRSRLAHQGYHDQLTRLPNRSLTEERLRRAFAPDSTVGRIGLCVLDLDGFKAVNDSLGHQVGDRLLLAVAARLRLAAGEHLVTRTGGDEFAIVVLEPNGLGSVCQLAEQVLERLRPPVALGAHELSVSASIGIAEVAVSESSPQELLRAADVALSWAKTDGKGRWVVFEPERDAGAVTRFALVASMPGAVERNEFDVLYQPLIRLSDGSLSGVEALVRWEHPQHGLLGPSQFIDMAEVSGAIVPLGRWVLTQACRQARRWVDMFGAAAPYVSVNVAPRQLAEPTLLADVAAVLSDTGLDPSKLQLEITERAVLDDESGALDTLIALRDMGIKLAIDDFGTGYSSLSYLRRLPVHALKIDGSFISGLRDPECASQVDLSIVQALISMAHALGLVVTAEWVETAGQARQLAEFGCDAGQGHWFGPPVSAGQVDELARLSALVPDVGTSEPGPHGTPG